MGFDKGFLCDRRTFVMGMLLINLSGCARREELDGTEYSLGPIWVITKQLLFSDGNVFYDETKEYSQSGEVVSSLANYGDGTIETVFEYDSQNMPITIRSYPSNEYLYGTNADIEYKLDSKGRPITLVLNYIDDDAERKTVLQYSYQVNGLLKRITEEKSQMGELTETRETIYNESGQPVTHMIKSQTALSIEIVWLYQDGMPTGYELKSWDSAQKDPTTQQHSYRCDEHGNVIDIIQDGVVIASYEYELIQDPSPYARLDGQFVPWLLY